MTVLGNVHLLINARSVIQPGRERAALERAALERAASHQPSVPSFRCPKPASPTSKRPASFHAWGARRVLARISAITPMDT
jgi:hypothetical protein